MKSGYMYILSCYNGKYYVGSTVNLELRLEQHKNGVGANFTKKHLPVKLVYFEFYYNIGDAFLREKEIQGWSKRKKEVLIKSQFGILTEDEIINKLLEYSKNYTQFPENKIKK